MALTESHYNFVKLSFKANTPLTGEELIKQATQGRDWRHTAFPPIIGIILAASFYPVTYFTFMPFAPAVPFLDTYYTGILAGRVANGGHAAYDRFGELFQSWAGRVGKKY